MSVVVLSQLFPTGDICQRLETFLVVTNGEGVLMASRWVEAGDAAVHRTARHDKELSGPYVNSIDTEKMPSLKDEGHETVNIVPYMGFCDFYVFPFSFSFLCLSLPPAPLRPHRPHLCSSQEQNTSFSLPHGPQLSHHL